MAYIVKLGTFAKKKNSTAQPDTSGWASFNSVLKQGSELTNPTLQLRIEESDLINYNYAYLFGGFYYITSRTMLRNDLAEIKLEKDVMATYKTAIGNTNLYIVRSSVTYDGTIKDNMYPMTLRRLIDNQTALIDEDILFSQGCYVVTTIGDTAGSSSLYLMGISEFTTFINSLYAMYGGVVGGSFSNTISNSIMDPIRYIRSVMWFPFDYSTAETAFSATDSYPAHVKCGLWDSGVTAHYIGKPAAVMRTWSITLNPHPQFSTRGPYMNGSPFTSHTLNFPPFGIIDLNADKLASSSSINIEFIVDTMSGMGHIVVAGNNSGVVASVGARIGVPLPISEVSADISAITKAVSGVGEMIIGAATANPFMIGIGAGQAVGSVGDAIHGSVSSMGSAGSMAVWQTPKTFFSTYYLAVDDDNIDNGRPLCQMQNPANLGGYMVAEKAPLAISCTRPELEEIQQYITTGFYYE